MQVQQEGGLFKLNYGMGRSRSRLLQALPLMPLIFLLCPAARFLYKTKSATVSPRCVVEVRVDICIYMWMDPQLKFKLP